ncbi:MAG: DUF2179 domain-containing protein [Candidatus Zhuqueibacterota bacterium]
MDSTVFNWVVLPMLIFSARIIDVSMGTLRIMYVSRGKRRLASCLGFVEVLIWLLAIRQIFNNLNNSLCYLAYAGGFATGSYIGMSLEQKLAIGIQVVRIITRRDASELIAAMKKAGYGVTIVNGEGLTGVVKIIFTVIQRKELQTVLGMVNRFSPNAFYSVEDVRMARETVFPLTSEKNRLRFWSQLKFEKNGK